MNSFFFSNNSAVIGEREREKEMGGGVLRNWEKVKKRRVSSV